MGERLPQPRPDSDDDLVESGAEKSAIQEAVNKQVQASGLGDFWKDSWTEYEMPNHYLDVAAAAKTLVRAVHAAKDDRYQGLVTQMNNFGEGWRSMENISRPQPGSKTRNLVQAMLTPYLRYFDQVYGPYRNIDHQEVKKELEKMKMELLKFCNQQELLKTEVPSSLGDVFTLGKKYGFGIDKTMTPDNFYDPHELTPIDLIKPPVFSRQRDGTYSLQIKPYFRIKS